MLIDRKQKKIYTATPEDNKIIRKWLDKCGDEDTKLKLEILDFYSKWIFEYDRKTDSIYHNSIYRILIAIGMNPKTDKQKQKEK